MPKHKNTPPLLQVYKYQHHLEKEDSTAADGSIAQDDASEEHEVKASEPKEKETGDGDGVTPIQTETAIVDDENHETVAWQEVELQ